MINKSSFEFSNLPSPIYGEKPALLWNAFEDIEVHVFWENMYNGFGNLNVRCIRYDEMKRVLEFELRLMNISEDYITENMLTEIQEIVIRETERRNEHDKRKRN